MKVKKLKAIEGGLVNVIIETPKGSQTKYAYDHSLEVFTLKKVLPIGATFPFDFGFIPNTIAPDGDPLDIFVLMDQPSYPGCLIPCRLLGILEATQTEKNGKNSRNDRLVGIADASVIYCDIRHVQDLNKDLVKQIEHFFISYNEMEEKLFKPIKWADRKKALKLIEKSR